MIVVNITPEMINRATTMANQLGTLSHSIRNGSGNIAGFLGEECFLYHYPDAIRVNGYEFDMVLNNFKVEIKTKDRTIEPSSHFECSISTHNPNQETDFYFFVSLLRQGDDYTKGYLLGYMDKDTYFKKAIMRKKGDIDPSNNFTVKHDCWNLPISQLNQIKRRNDV